MGFLTTITIHNDALHSFKADPELFGQAILDGVDEACSKGREVSVGFKGYCNYINVQPARHADDETVYIHTGNTVFNLAEYGKDFEALAKRNPALLKDFIKRARRILKSAESRVKQITPKLLDFPTKNS